MYCRWIFIIKNNIGYLHRTKRVLKKTSSRKKLLVYANAAAVMIKGFIQSDKSFANLYYDVFN
jgi:hypothetical protein